MTQTLTSI